MKQGKETRPIETTSKDPQILGINYDEVFNNRLRLTEEIKSFLREKSLVWRFIAAQQFAQDGNMDAGYWKPYNFSDCPAAAEFRNVDGFIRRGDLILATRTKHIDDLHKKFKADRVARQTGNYNKIQAEQLKQAAREAGMGKTMRVHEGYEENE